MTDLEIVTGVQRQDHDAVRALDRLVREQSRKVFQALPAIRESDREDLAQDALVNVLTNLSKFDPKRGSLAGWVYVITRNTIQRGAQYSLIHLSSGTKSRAAQVQSTRRRLEDMNGYEPSIEEVADELGWSQSQVFDLFEASAPMLSLDDTFEDIDGNIEEWHDVIADPRAEAPFDAIIEDAAGEVEKYLCVLDELDQKIIRLRYGIGGHEYTLMEVATILDLHHSTVQRREQAAMERLYEEAQNIRGVSGS